MFCLSSLNEWLWKPRYYTHWLWMWHQQLLALAWRLQWETNRNVWAHTFSLGRTRRKGKLQRRKTPVPLLRRREAGSENLASCSLSPQKTENGDRTGSRWCEVLVLCLALRKHDREKISPGVSESKGEEQDDEGHFPTLTAASLEKVTANRSFRYFFSNGQLSASPTGPENLYSQFSKIGCNLFWLLKADENWL